MERLYEIWMQGVKVEAYKADSKTIQLVAKKFCEGNKTEVFVCRLVKTELKPVFGFFWNGKKVKKIGKPELEGAYVLSIEMKKKAGRKRSSGGAETGLSIAVSLEDKAKFEDYATKFANGNKSEMFRRMFNSWEKMMEQVIGGLQ